MNRFVKFFLTAWALSFFTLSPIAMFLPPDPLTQLPFFVFSLVFTFVAAYWLVYRDGFATIRAQVS
ncbi:hypothetical protein [Haladaptatus sp. DJG-WS-42]|uniref:DUF7534 family protein n=1 Tax=Haladaptatus sp. DJG-WS-42 TaxID=3120516 RepID=UPI0030D1A883